MVEAVVSGNTGSLDEEIKNSPELQESLARAIDDYESGRVYPLEEAMQMAHDMRLTRRTAIG